MPRRAGRRDTNDAGLVALARLLGFHMVKAPPLDYWACLRGKWGVVEIKRPDKKGWKSEFTPYQHRFIADCRLFGSTWSVWRTPEDVLKASREWS